MASTQSDIPTAVRTPRAAFQARRNRLLSRIERRAVLLAGAPRARNFPANRFPFRAESHFLYLIGDSIPDAVLVLDPQSGAVLYAHKPDPDDAIWHGPSPSLAELSDSLGVSVRPLSELPDLGDADALPTHDGGSAARLLGRPVGDTLGDRQLADVLIELRLRHDEAAVAQLRAAAAVTVAAHRTGMAATPGCRFEYHVRAAMEAEIMGHAMACSYNPIVTVRGEILHNETYDNPIGDTDLILADVGAETREGWAGDVTRVWPAGGRFSSTQRALYDVVLKAERAAIDAVAPGVRYRDVHHIAGRELISGLCELGILRGDPDELFHRGVGAVFFPHGVGHLLGLDVHDMEDLGDRAGYAAGRARATSARDRYLRLDRDLQPGMAVTIEPGFYAIEGLLTPDALGDRADAIDRNVLKRFSDVRGIRIEDDVLVTQTGHEVLTDGAPKTSSEVERAVAGG